MKPLTGVWSGIVGGTNLGKVSASFTQVGQSSVTGQFTFHDLITVPLKVQFQGQIEGRWIEGALSNFLPPAVPPVGIVIPASGRILGLIEDDNKITGFWMTNVWTSGGFILSRQEG